MGKFSYTWQLMRASWDVLRRDKQLIIFPLLSGICCIIVVASFIVPMALGHHPNVGRQMTTADKVESWVTLFAFYFANYFVITFFNVGIVACAASRMAGGEPTFAGGLREAMSRIHLIAGWALVAATVGTILKAIEQRSEKVGSIVASILGAAWSIMTFLVVPVIVIENKGPIDALKTSTQLLRKTWGEQIVGNFSFGLIFFLLSLPGIIGIVAAGVMFAAGNHFLAILLGGCGVAYLIVLSLIQSALAAIFQAAVYMYTQGITDNVRGFPVVLLKDAMTTA